MWLIPSIVLFTLLTRKHFDQNIFKRILHEIRVFKNLDAKFELDRLIERL